jgi:hypothetical protein
MTDPLSLQASDPATTAETLARIAYERPDLRPAVAANPAAYPELLTWLEQFHDPAVSAAIAARRGVAPGAGWAPAASAAPQGGQQPAYQQAPQGQGTFTPQAQQGGYNAQSQQGGYNPQAQQPGYGQPAQGGFGFAGPAQSYTSYDSAMAPARKSRKKAIIAGTVAGGVLLLGGGSVAAYQMFFSKLGGAESPDQAAVRLVEGFADKDMVAMYGVLSPAEIEHSRTNLDAWLDDVEGLGGEAIDYEALLATLDLEVEGLKIEVENIEEGLAKVYFTDGTLTVDADEELLAGEVAKVATDLVGNPLFADYQDLMGPIPSEEEMKTQLLTEMEGTFPVSVTTDQMQVADDAPFVMAVEEDGSWYVSPYLTLGEYAIVESDVARGTLAGTADAAGFDSPEAAAVGMTDAAVAFATTGDMTPLVNAMPLAERRLLALYVAPSASEFTGEEMPFEVTSKEFRTRSEDKGVAEVVFENFTISIDDGVQPGTVTLSEECLALAHPTMNGQVCYPEMPLVREFSLEELSFIALEEDGGWFLSPSATMSEAFATLGRSVLDLYESGRYEDQAWIDAQTAELETYLSEKLGVSMDDLGLGMTPSF